MILIPAIDLKNGQCVRLRQGLMEDATIFSDDSVAMASRWTNLGARRLHLVDLDGAFEGKPENEAAIMEILSAIGNDVPVQLGGGIREMSTIEKYLSRGLSFAVIGTAAVTRPNFVREACAEFEGRIMVGLDAKNGQVAIDGWANVTEHNVLDLTRKFKDFGVESIIYTDIGRDGMMTGVNLESTRALAKETDLPVIASGGIHSIDNVRQVKALECDGVIGAITGRAIYEGALDFEEANKIAAND